jgi:hypothetical protein
MSHISKFSDFLRKRNQLSTDIEKLKSQLNGLLKHNDINNLDKDAKYQNMDSVDKTLFLSKLTSDIAMLESKIIDLQDQLIKLQNEFIRQLSE